jgi:hypothetical protein
MISVKNIILQHKELEKEEQNKLKVSRSSLHPGLLMQ